VSRIDTIPDGYKVSRRTVAPGDVLGDRFRLLEHLGSGAMGDIYVAENVALGRRVAVKVLKPELVADPAFRQRFQQEAEAISAIEHRNVIRFLDLIVDDPIFLVMEYAAGPTLSAELRQEGRLPLLRAVHIARRLLHALDATHRAGIIHRDVKPANVILTPDPELGDEPKLIDFGLAKLASPVGGEPLTRAGQIVGTPAYMSPEQIGNKEVGPRSDLYSLGCVLYHMLAGRPPFDISDEVQLIYLHINEAPPPLRQLCPELPEAVERLLARALAKQPEARFADAREMIEALGEIDLRKPAAPQAPRTPSLVLGLSAALGGAAITLVALSLLGRGPTAPGSQLLVSTEPEGATLELDGKPVELVSPAALAVTPGRHRVTARLAGRQPVDQYAEVGAKARVSLRLTLPEQSRALTIETVPTGAQVFIDGHLALGQTPFEAQIVADDFHQIRVEKPGYESKTVNLPPEDTTPRLVLTLEAEKRPQATVWVDANRTAQVFIDGVDSGWTTPTVGIRVAPGKHRIELRDAAGGPGPSLLLDLAQGETRHLLLEFDRPKGAAP
jgi:tRNA A-37 threonylcarbamoyl transferase component Bud32